MNKNIPVMEHSLGLVKSCLSRCGKLRELEHDYKSIRIYGLLKFNVNKYLLEGVGNVSVMTVNMGFMQMGTLIVTPYKKDLPILSTDLMYSSSKRKYILEMDCTVLHRDEAYLAKCAEAKAVIDKYNDLELFPQEPCWQEEYQDVLARKQGTNTVRLDGMIVELCNLYAEWASSMPALCPEDEKLKKAKDKEFSDKLIDLGGISTDIFKKAKGVDFTRDFFDKVLFGAGEQ